MSKPDARHAFAYDEFNKMLKKITRRFPEMSAEDLLVIGCNIVGKLIAMQDMRKYTEKQIMELVQNNIEQGNKEMISAMLKTGKAGNG